MTIGVLHRQGTTYRRGEREDDPPIGSRADGGGGAIRALSVAALARLCEAETRKFLLHETSCDAFSLELFRRAICERDPSAWEAVVAQYRGVVRAWLHRHPAWPAVEDNDDDWINRVFARFWLAVSPERFLSFPGMAALLRYLKLCVHSLLLDELRSRQAGRLTQLTEDITDRYASDAVEALTGELASQTLWEAISAEIRDERERIVAHHCLMLDWKPREIFARYPERFADTQAVYCVKRNLLDRLRRSPAIREFLG